MRGSLLHTVISDDKCHVHLPLIEITEVRQLVNSVARRVERSVECDGRGHDPRRGGLADVQGALRTGKRGSRDHAGHRRGPLDAPRGGRRTVRRHAGAAAGGFGRLKQ